jgi:hypothetical protein
MGQGQFFRVQRGLQQRRVQRRTVPSRRVHRDQSGPASQTGGAGSTASGGQRNSGSRTATPSECWRRCSVCVWSKIGVERHQGQKPFHTTAARRTYVNMGNVGLRRVSL